MTTVAQSVIEGLWMSILNMPVIAIVLFVAGLALLAVECFTPGFGVAGGVGLALLFVAILFTAQSVLEGIILTLILIAAGGIFLTVLLYSASHGRLSRKLILRDATDTASGYSGTPAYGALLGKTGMTATVLRPSGAALIDGSRIDVVTQGEYIEPGIVVEVLRVEGNRVVVRALPEIHTH